MVMKKRRTYTAEFKGEVLQLLEASGKSAHALEQELGIGKGCIRRWQRALASNGQGACPDHGRLTLEQRKVRELERRLRVAEQEREILEKQWPSSRAQVDEVSVHR